uniref:Protein phosphatase 1 regulatory subunit 12A n=1 Tax=Rousettus aegyptiacus TaxID=9407 RepID=A0A7J8JJU4_ROUAE|nr:protein phosphatase 1 regulatory subunit 12A [Rousettus aegyptiacus]
MVHLQKSQHLKRLRKKKTLQVLCVQLQVLDFPPHWIIKKRKKIVKELGLHMLHLQYQDDWPVHLTLKRKKTETLQVCEQVVLIQEENGKMISKGIAQLMKDQLIIKDHTSLLLEMKSLNPKEKQDLDKQDSLEDQHRG